MSHLSTMNIIRAWKDPEYRLSLSEADLAKLPEHPAGLIGLTDAQLNAVAGGSADRDARSGNGNSGDNSGYATCVGEPDGSGGTCV